MNSMAAPARKRDLTAAQLAAIAAEMSAETMSCRLNALHHALGRSAEADAPEPLGQMVEIAALMEELMRNLHTLAVALPVQKSPGFNLAPIQSTERKT
jgi:hypothetical protein